MAAAVRMATPAHDGLTGTTSNFSWPMPVGAQVGDLALVAVGSGVGSTQTFPTPSGWTLISGQNSTGSSHTSYLFGKILTLDDLSGSFSGSWTAAGKLHGGGMIISGAAGIPSGASVQFLTDVTDGLTLLCPNVITPSDNNLILCIALGRMAAAGAQSGSLDAAYTRDAEGHTSSATTPNFVAELGHRTSVAATAGTNVTGATVTLSDATGRGHMWTIAIEPAAAVLAPDSAFSTSVSSGTAPLTVDFTDTSTGAPTSWIWDFGDGGSSTQRHPTHTFTAPGTYTVTLTAKNSGGPDLTPATQTITVTGTAGYHLFKLRGGLYVPAEIRPLRGGTYQ